jgi:chemotaxis signal transduction protein
MNKRVNFKDFLNKKVVVTTNENTIFVGFLVDIFSGHIHLKKEEFESFDNCRVTVRKEVYISMFKSHVAKMKIDKKLEERK